MEDGPDSRKVAVKAQRPSGCLAHEYDIIQKIQERLGSRAHHSSKNAFPKAFSFLTLADGAMMGLSAGSTSGLNLLDLVNVYKLQFEQNVPEILALHYTARILCHLEALHWHAKILHCDAKPDNWVLVSSPNTDHGLIFGSDLALVDFGRAIDLERAKKRNQNATDAKLIGEAASENMLCAAMMEGSPWSFDVDTFGACAAAYVLLFGEHIEIEKNGAKRWTIRNSLKNLEFKAIWETMFDRLLNLDGSNRKAIGSHPKCVQELRCQIEAILRNHSDHLTSALCRQANFLPEGRRELYGEVTLLP